MTAVLLWGQDRPRRVSFYSTSAAGHNKVRRLIRNCQITTRHFVESREETFPRTLNLEIIFLGKNSAEKAERVFQVECFQSELEPPLGGPGDQVIEKVIWSPQKCLVNPYLGQI